MSIDRSELERLLADRPAGSRSAMQAVRESYADIGLMRERGLSWAEISDLLAKLGVTARDNQPISPVTLRSAFFLVGSEGRGGTIGGDHAAASAPTPTPVETLAAVHEAALSSGMKDETPTSDGQDVADPGTPPATDGQDAGPEPATDGIGETVAEEAPVSDAAPVPQPVEAEPELGPSVSNLLAPATAAAAEDEPDATGTEGETDTEPTADSGASSRTESGPGSETVIPTSDITGPAPRPASPHTPATAMPDTGPSVSPSPFSPMTQDDSTNAHWKGDRMLGTIFVLNDRGGVGKTLLSHHLMATAMLEGLQLKVVEYEVNERLARLFGPDMVEHRRITQDFMNLMGSGDGFYEFWDLIGPELQRGGRLYDFGGNISQWFFNWAEVSGFDYYVGDGERLTFMVPVTVDLASLSTGMTTLERVATIAPKAKRVLVENGFSGPFSQLEDSQYARRKAEMVEREGLQVISMPPCTAPAWARLTGHRLDQVATMTREDLVKLGMTPPVASRSLIIIHEWLRNMRQALSPYLHDAFRQTPAAAKTR
ncbi:hypothetical protein AZL_014890 [Azospirillum sp. B510]|uniref:hypothetical protein n=1 Tax=Azospirillum sp. (strain B510) TaxID=137722 RepID=UPI0001C4C501|nr:hypothetical protein [Azospirillum sp. B510]BAI72127.1 hypothetical protein AZL_014890 [Azospirillum sp. B510]